MKKISLIVVFSAILLAGYGQSITFGVLVPSGEQEYTISQRNLLQSRMEGLCNRNGIAVMNIPDGFFLYPTIVVVSDEVAEGGLQNIYSIKAEVTLSVRKIGGDVVASVGKTYSGAGRSKSQAMTSLIQSIKIDDPIFSKFFADAKKAVCDDYQTQCEQIMAKSEQQASINDYRAALAILFQIPLTAPCYSSVNTKMAEYYNQYQSLLCSTIKLDVGAAMATHDYEAAAILLTEIDPTSDCYPYAVEQFKRIEEEVASLEKREWDFKMKQYNDAVSLERRRLEVVSEVAKRYYSTQPTIHYTQIIR